jgi:hypothetical protein
VIGLAYLRLVANQWRAEKPKEIRRYRIRLVLHRVLPR